MEKRFVTFLILAFALLSLNAWFIAWQRGPEPPAEEVAAGANAGEGGDEAGDQAGDADEGAEAEGDADDDDGAEDAVADEGDEPTDEAAPVDAGDEDDDAEDDDNAILQAAAADEAELTYLTLGSIDPESGFAMLLTFTNRGAALVRAELSDPTYRDVEDESGYLGHLSLRDAATGIGCEVHVVGDGTPAAKAGVAVGDVIVGIGETEVSDTIAFRRAVATLKPRETITLKLRRGGRLIAADVTLTTRPQSVIAPEGTDPLSLLVTLARYDELRLDDEELELAGVRLRTGNWRATRDDANTITFRKTISDKGLEVFKRFHLDKLEDDPRVGHHVEMELGIKNVGSEGHTVAYQLDGPTGLPTEGAWYIRKISRSMGSTGLRDVVVGHYDEGTVRPGMVGAPTIAEGELDPPWVDEPVAYLGVDTQYFGAMLLPERKKDEADQVLFASTQPIRVGPVPEEDSEWNLTNVSSRMRRKPWELAPGEARSDAFDVFIGPKKTELLSAYGLDEVVYYGWFGPVAGVMASLLHVFAAIVPNYGIAIILLTVLVRGMMFPLSRKQTMNAQKMQELQPELKRLQEKYKNDLEKRSRAQQELFRKHNYNPLAGCFPIFIQLPIFIGLYRALSVDLELRGAPLLWESFPWCTNLAAPDMLFRWDGFVPGFVVHYLGPYFNLLPIVTVFLFVAQQKMFMPPPADEQAELQQKIMRYMMIFIGFLFFTVPSGLCVYFIASSLWGIAERKLLPKTTAASGSTDGGGGGGGSGGDKSSGDSGGGGLAKLAALASSGNGQGGSNGQGGGKRKKKKQRGK